MRALAILTALILTACTPPESQPSQQSQAGQQAAAEPNNCPAQASTPWSAGQITYTVQAVATGADCASASVAFTVRDPSGASIAAETYQANQVMTLANAESVADMERRLAEWITPAGAARDSTGDLPVWEVGADHPMSGEFPFYQDDGLDRAAYEALRRADAPMYCYVQGMESEACLVLQNGAFRKIGVQSFPG